MPRDDDEYEDFGARMAKQVLGGRTALIIPQGLSLFKPKRSGSMTLDFIPFLVTEKRLEFDRELQCARPGKRFPETTYYNHRKIGINGDSFPCLSKTFGVPCPVCQAAAEFKKSPLPQDVKSAAALKPSNRQLSLVWDSDDPDRGVQLWDESNWNLWKHIMLYIDGARKEEREAYKLFYHRSNGFSIRLTCVKENIGGGENYIYMPHAFYPRRQPIPDHIWDHGYDLDAMVRKFDYQAMKDIYHGTAEVTEEANKPNDEPPPRRDQRPPARTEAPSRNGHDERDEQPPPRTARPPAAAPARQQQWDDEPPAKPVNRTKPAPAREPDPEPPADEPITCATNDAVSFEYRGDRLEGTVLRIDATKQLVFVDVESFSKPFTVPMEDITVERADTTFDLKNPPPEDPKPAKKKAAAPPPDDEPETPPARPTRAVSPAPTTKTAKANAWDDDDGSDDGRGAPAVAPKKPSRK